MNDASPTTTNAGGVYTFTNLTPGDYFVGFRVPAGYAVSPRDVGSDDAADSDADPQTGQTVSTTLTAGENDPTWDLGLYPLARLGDTVWSDTDADGLQDVGETGVQGVTVNMTFDPPWDQSRMSDEARVALDMW